MQTETIGVPPLNSPAVGGPDRAAAGRRTYALAVAGLIALGGLIRLALIALDWPETNSDEGFLGLMAMHIAYDGDRPTFYPGQNYMGPHEGYLGAALFRLFGSSLFVLRLGLVLLFVLFLISSYLFTRIVYGRRWALIAVALLALGSPYVLSRELTAIGGYGETLLISSLLFLLTARLVLAYRPYRVFREHRWRLVGYAAWGVLAGTGLWADLLIAPFALTSGVVLLVHCRREFAQLAAPLVAGAGLVLGMFPLLWFNLHAAPGTDTLTTLSVVRGDPPVGLDAKLHAVWNAVRVSVPLMTGEPVCPVEELPALGPATSWSRPCALTRAGWGTGYMLLLGVATLLAAWAVWRAWRRRRTVAGDATGDLAADRRRASLHLAMLVGGLITFYLYASSDAPVDWPGGHSRYLIGLVVALPAVFRPLGEGIAVSAARRTRLARVVRLGRGAALAAYCAALAAGTVLAFTQVPRTHADAQRTTVLVDTLLQHDVKHFYADYWTCGRVAFRAQERITCGSLTASLGIGPAQNRYYQYWTDTTADPRAAYVFSDNPCRSLPLYSCKGTWFLDRSDGTYRLPTVAAKLDEAGTPYQVLHVDGYVIYLVG